MIKIKKICINNLRCLNDTNDIELKPLTVVVGRNSSGKSTFLRTFPLLKQTIETKTSEPILWYGNYTDFGNFEESLNSHSNQKSICFTLEFDIGVDYFKDYLIRYNALRNIFNYVDKKYYNLRVSFKFNKFFIQELTIFFEDHKIEFIYQSKESLSQLKINDTIMDISNLKPDYMRNVSCIFPSIYSKDDEFMRNSCDSHFSKLLFEEIRKFSYQTTRNETLLTLIEQITLGSSESILNSLKNNRSTSAQVLIRNLSRLELNDENFQVIRNYVIGKYLNSIIDACNSYIENDFLTVKYIAPLRASAERYYRVQGLSIDEIDPRGENITMLLYNMRDTDKKNFQDWIKENFGFSIITSLKGGHVSLKIKDLDTLEEFNLADTGFGYSQILPIIVLLWQSLNYKNIKITNRKLRRMTGFPYKHTIVIEQPELHLHPAIQAKLIDVFIDIINVSKVRGIDLKIIIETHSETMINRLGYLIAKKRTDSNLINVLIFDKIKGSETNVTSTTYSEKGYLLKWPIGFFSPENK